jgi:predicted  nucleic acid-binding Zn-ribbon protein
MEKKHELTEQLKLVETEIYDAKMDLKCIESKLNMAYNYEEELNQRLVAAKMKTQDLQNQFFQKASTMSQLYEKMKNIFDIFTGNFYRH